MKKLFPFVTLPQKGARTTDHHNINRMEEIMAICDGVSHPVNLLNEVKSSCDSWPSSIRNLILTHRLQHYSSSSSP